MLDYKESPSQLADISTLSALSPDDPGKTTVESFVSTSGMNDNSIQAINPASTDYLDGFKPDQVIKYTVEQGDSIASIASDYGVSTNTIIWANNIRNPNQLSLGQVLKILPVSGVIHTVKNGDTVASIAKEYKADSQKILSFNKIETESQLESGIEIIVPDGEMPGPNPIYIAKSVTVGSQVYLPTRDGQCVSFVQAHGYSGLRGNAKDWRKYINTSYPQAGGVVVFVGKSYGRYGHIALITSVKEDSIQVVEQNFYGLRVVDHREVPINNSTIAGFIR